MVEKQQRRIPVLSVNEEAVLWYIVYMDVATGVDKREKMDYYQNAYDSAQVNDIKEYTQTDSWKYH